MKKKILISSIFLSAFCAVVYAISNGGTATDPLVTQSTADSLVNNAVNEYIENTLNFYENPTEQIVSNIIEKDADSVCFLRNDTISNIDIGDKIIYRSGDITLSGTGTLINLSNGTTVENPTSLATNVQYLVAENSNFTITVNGLTSFFNIDGSYTHSNPYTVKYLNLADGLRNLGLLQGTNYGYQLARPATRVEALIMFVRLIGEEAEALAYTGSHPFTDVASWSDSYVAYAYNKGYTNGMTLTTFEPSRPIRDLDYYTFILRALNYKDNEDFTWSLAYDKAIEIGLVSSDFPNYQELYRDLLVYISYTALEQTYANETATLAELLIQNDIISLEDFENLKDLV
ncbi:MAG: S-layer homology domain-containing protein [Clostridia bacterium]